MLVAGLLKRKNSQTFTEFNHTVFKSFGNEEPARVFEQTFHVIELKED